VLKTTRSRCHAVYPCWRQRDLVVMRFIRVEDNEISLSCGLSVLKTTRSRCHAVYPCWRQRDLVVMRFIRVEDNEISLSCGLSVLKTTRSRWKFRICTTTNDLTVYTFSSLYIFVTWGWPTVAETCRQSNKTDTKTVVFWRTYPLQICIKHDGGDTSKVLRIFDFWSWNMLPVGCTKTSAGNYLYIIFICSSEH